MTMENYYFDDVVDRRGSYSASYDFMAHAYGEEVISLAIAEMDILTCPDVRKAVRQATEYGVYSYTDVPHEFGQACSHWFKNVHGWSFPDSHVLFSPRIIELIAAIVNHVIPRARVGTFSPFYGPIVQTIRKTGGGVLTCSLSPDPEGVWRFDEAEVSALFTEIDIFLLTNPHNPTGRVWSEQELTHIAKAARENGVLIISDDIHCDIVSAGATWRPIAQLCSEKSIDADVITCVSPAKSFNMAGLEAAAAVISHSDLRERVFDALQMSGIHNPNYFAIPAALAAWNSDGTWLRSLNKYLAANRDFTVAELGDGDPQITLYRPESTYLLWGHAPDLLPDASACHELSRCARVLISPGENFGSEWNGYFRIGVALPRPRLRIAVGRLKNQINAMRKD